MKFLILFLLLLVAAPTLPAQAPGITQDSELITVPPGDKFLRWYGHAERSYFLQVSDPNDHLRKWSWAPVIEGGNDEEISYEIDGTATKGFFRLKYTDQVPGLGETLETADFDNDGIPNINEIDPPAPLSATDPLNPDTDGDGLNDGWERANSLDPNDDGSINPDNGSAGDPDGDGATNAAEAEAGTDPNDPDDSPAGGSWHSVTGDKPEGEPKKETKTFTIKKGESRLVVVGITSEEYPVYTGDASEWNDTLEWNITPSSGDAITGSLNVNDRHGDWEFDEIAGVTLHGFGSSPPVHIEQAKMIQAPLDADVTVEVELTATNISDGILPSTVIVGLVPVVQRDEDVPDGNWSPLAGRLAKALPGEKMNLKMDSSKISENVDVTDFEWTLPEKAFKDYEADNAHGKLIPLEQGELEDSEVEFYFGDSGVKEIQLKFTVNGLPVDATLLLTVEKPVSEFGTMHGAVRLGIGTSGAHSLGFLGFTQIIYGVRFLGAVTTPEGWPLGEWNWVQLIKSRRDFTNPPNGAATHIGDGTTLKLDSSYPYLQNGAMSANGLMNGAIGDSPSEGALSFLRSTISIAESFETYLMFRPAGTESRPVPLRKANWKWGGKATAADGWTAVTDPVAEVDAQGAEFTIHPEWDANSQGDTEQNGN